MWTSREALRRSGRRRHGRSAARLCRQCHLQDRRLSRLGPLTAPVRGHAKIMARFESMIANLALSDFAILDLFVDGCRPLASQRVPCGNRGRVHHRNRAVPGSRAWPSGLLGRVLRYGDGHEVAGREIGRKAPARFARSQTVENEWGRCGGSSTQAIMHTARTSEARGRFSARPP